jgi:tetratricopeptide (TPR) repeat protein
MSDSGHFIRGLIILALFAALLVVLVWQTIKSSDDPARIIFKWIITAGIVGIMIKVVAPMVGQGGYSGAFVGIPATAVCGLALAIVWRRNLAELVASPFASLYDGGNVPPEPRPAYSTAQSRQKQGRYLEAIAEIRQQLDKFPTDLEGHLLMAQIQAEDLKDMPSAELTIQRLCSQPGHAPANIAFALYSLADWSLKIAHDREAAQRALEQVISLLPDSEFALTAAQRIAHLGTTEMLLSPQDRKKFALQEAPKNLGIMTAPPSVVPVEKDPAQLAAEYVTHLETHPLDTEIREKLAVLYADHYQRLDLATDQLEQLIQQPNQPGRQIVRWLNHMADLQIRCGADYDTIRATLQRIIDRNPNLAAAENARKRIELLRLELKGKQQNQTVKMGSYEQNIGLKNIVRPRHLRD